MSAAMCAPGGLDDWLERELPIALASAPGALTADPNFIRSRRWLPAAAAAGTTKLVFAGAVAAATLGAGPGIAYLAHAPWAHHPKHGSTSAPLPAQAQRDRIHALVPGKPPNPEGARGRGPIAVPPGHARVDTFPGHPPVTPPAKPVHAVGRGPAISGPGRP